jgi:vacuolar-type H+-ATPase subunit H
MTDGFNYDGDDIFSQFDDEGYTPAYTPGVDTVEGLVHQMIEMIDDGKKMSFSSTVKVGRDDMLALLNRVLELAPEEVVSARHVLKQSDFIMQEAQRKATQVLQTAKVNAARMVEKVEIVRQARMKAEQIIADAEATARARTNEVDDHIDQYLAKVSVLAERLRQTAETGRERLRPMLQPFEVAPPPAPAPAPMDFAEPALDGWTDDAYGVSDEPGQFNPDF